eukprot:5637687-Amphidinium_carterae.1
MKGRLHPSPETKHCNRHDQVGTYCRSLPVAYKETQTPVVGSSGSHPLRWPYEDGSKETAGGSKSQ